MGLLEKCFRQECAGIPRGVGAAILYDDRIIKQVPGNREPGFADEGAGDQHLSFCSTQAQRPLAGLSQDPVNDLQWESGENVSIPRRGFLRLMKRNVSSMGVAKATSVGSLLPTVAPVCLPLLASVAFHRGRSCIIRQGSSCLS